jgi:1,4-dihydroxy-2-naphthoate octaprenyltransferase
LDETNLPHAELSGLGLTVVGVVFGTLAIATGLTAFQDHMVNWAIIVVVVPAGHHCLMRKLQESLQDLKVLRGCYIRRSNF